MRSTVQRGGLGLVGVLLLLAGLAVLSARTGGPVSWHITAGGSMKPGISPGTLVVVGRSPSYDVGEVVAYPSAQLRGQVVLHRVVRIEDGRLVLQGDANSWLDPERPLPSEALGARLFQVGGVGSLLGWLGRPGPMGAGVAMIALPFLSVQQRSRRRRRGTPTGYRAHGLPASGPMWDPDDESVPGASPSFRLPSSGPTWSDEPDAETASGTRSAGPSGPPPSADVASGLRRGLRLPDIPSLPASVETGLAVVAGGLAVLAVAATIGPLVHTTTPGRTAEHVVTWGYGAQVAPGLVYDDGVVQTGDTLYTRLVSAVDVTAELRVDVPEGSVVTGTWALDVAVEDDSGWQRTTHEGSPLGLSGPLSQSGVVLPVTDLLALAQRAAEESGVQPNGRRVAVRARLELAVESDGTRVTTQATPELVFAADAEKLRLLESAELQQRGAITLPTTARASTVELAGMSLPALPTRLTALAGVLLSLAMLALLRVSRREEDEDARIARTAGHLLVPVDPSVEPDAVVDISSFEALAELATRYERMVLFGDDGGLRFYFVLDDGIAYRYYNAAAAARLDAAKAAARAAEEAAREDASGHGTPAPVAAAIPRQRSAERGSARR